MFFFKKKTSYEMRIIDWSSDVCSSDLAIFAHRELFKAAECRRRHSAALKSSRCAKIACDRKRPRNPNPATKSQPFFDEIRKTVLARGSGGSRVIHFWWVSLNSRSPMGRSEERRVGKGCVNTCRSRGSRCHKKQKKQKNSDKK